MTLALLAVLRLILTFADTDAKLTASREASECDDCNENEPWRPLFKPSQIIHSEFPEHAQYKSQEQGQYNSREHEPHYSSHEGSHFNSLEQTVAHPSGPGIDSRVRTYSSQGRHRVEWDHYGDVSHVTTVSYQSLEDRGGSFNPEGSNTPHNSVEVARASQENHSKEPDIKTKGAPEDVSANSEDVSFFSDGSFFDEKFTSPKDYFSRDFDISKDSSFSDEVQSSNSIEPMSSKEGLGRYRTPVATSYSAMSSVFAGARPVHPQPRDLRHELTYNDINKYIKSRHQHPVSQTQFTNGRNVTKQYLVHEPQSENPGSLVINHIKGRSSSNPGPYVPMNHPVYRYVKSHGGLTHNYNRQPLRWQDIHPELRSKFPFKHLQPYVRVQNHETVIRHVIPTKDPFSDSFWKESKPIEDLKPPPLGQTLYFFKKKQKPLDFNNLRRRQGNHNNYVYIIKTNKRLS